MTTTAGTTPDDVRRELETELSDADIDEILDRVEREIDRAYDKPGFQSTQHRVDFEAVLAALRIAENRDRRVESSTVGDSEVVYEADVLPQLRRRVRRDDPGEAFGRPSDIIRDSNRYVGGTE